MMLPSCKTSLCKVFKQGCATLNCFTSVNKTQPELRLQMSNRIDKTQFSSVSPAYFVFYPVFEGSSSPLSANVPRPTILSPSEMNL